MGEVTDDYEDLQRMIDEMKAMHKALLPPIRIERGYEIVGLEIVDILQDMALEDESGASKENPAAESKRAEIALLKAQLAELEK